MRCWSTRKGEWSWSAGSSVPRESFPMEAGDLVVIPGETEYDHHNGSGEPAIWLDSLDEELLNLVNQVMQGNLTLHWFDAKTEPVRAVPSDPQRGLTYDDTNIGSYGYDAIAETLRNKYTMAPRGSEIWGRLPDLGYTINRKSDVWSENVARLYEEARAGAGLRRST